MFSYPCRFYVLLSSLLLLSNTISAAAERSSRFTLPASTHPHQLWRALALGDYDEFNALFKDASVALPDNDVSKSGLKLKIRNLVCREISIGDMQTNFSQTSARTLVYGIFLNPFNFVCQADYSYKYSFLIKGSGRLTAKARRNRADAQISFTSPTTFGQDPPTTTSVQGCKTHIDIYDMSFKGGIVAKILDLLEDAIDGVIEKEVEAAVCSELEAMEELLDGFLESMKGRVNPYLQPIPEILADPLQAENELIVPRETNLVNFNRTWLEQVLAQADLLLGEVVEDPNQVAGTTDLMINLLLRDRILDEQRALSILTADISKGSSGFNPVLFEGHDFLTESSITLDALRVFGMDTLETVDPLNIVGNFTFQNEFAWKYLNLELDLTVNIKPSTQPDALIQNPNPVEITEKIRVKFGFNDIRLLVSFMFAFDMDEINQIELGSVLKSSNLFGCFMKSLFQGAMAGLDFSVSSIDDPSLEGFISKGIDRFISESVKAVFIMYEPTFIRAMPYIFQDMVRSVLQESILDPMVADVNGENCPSERWPKDAIDFRDLFLNPGEAQNMGGSGTSPYGDIANVGFDMAMTRITEIGMDGSPMVNEMIIRPVTESQSGQEGSLAFKKALFSLKRENISGHDDTFGELVDSFEVRLSDVRVNNLDKIVAPLVVLEPTTQKVVLDNAITVGNSTTEPLTLIMRLLLSLEGSPPFDMLNEIDLSVSAGSLAVNAEIGALVDGAMVSRFPLLRVLDIDCWVAALSTDGVKETIQGLSVETFESILSSLSLDAKCVSCSSEGTNILPDLVTLVRDSGASETLRERLPRLLVDVVESDWLQDALDQWIVDAPSFCSFLPEYTETAERSGLSGLPTLQSESIDTLLYTSFMAGWVGFLVFAENQRLQDFEPSDPLSAQRAFRVEKGAELLDWNNIGNSTGLGPVGDAALDQVRSYLGGADSSGSPTINALIADFLDDDSGMMSFAFNDAVFQHDGLVFAFDSINLDGLDSVEYLDVLKPIGEQTLNNSIRLRSLGVQIKLRVGHEQTMDPDQEVTIHVAFEDVSVDAAIFAAFDVVRLRNLPLSAILKVDHVLPCFLSAMFELQVPQFVVTVGSFATPVVTGLEEETSSSMRRFLEGTMEKFGEELVESVPVLFEGITKELSSALLSSFGENVECPEPTISSSTGLVDFRDLLLPKDESVEYGGSGTAPYGDAIRMLWEFIEENILSVDPVTGLSPINEEVIVPWSEKQSGVPGRYTFGDLFDQETRINAGGLNAKFNVGLFDLRADNLDTIGAPLSMIDPIRGLAYQLNNTASAGVGNPIRLAGRFVFELVGDDSAIKNDVDVSLSLDKFTVILEALMKVLEPAFLGLPIEAIGNWRCWLAMMPAPSLDRRGIRKEDSEISLALLELGLSVAQFGLNITCNECTGPDMQQLVERLSEPGAANETTRVANDILDYATQLLEGEYLQVALDRLVVDSRKRCPASPEYVENAPPSEYAPFQSIVHEDSIGFLVALAVTMVLLATLLSLLLLTIRMIVRRRHRKWIRSLRTLSESTLALLVIEQKKEDERASQINELSKSLFKSHRIPLYLRYGVPVIILGNIAFFLSGHLSLGGSISIVLTLAGESYVADDFFDFSMAKSALEIWNAGGKELALLLLIFSGVWPYSKQLITLGLWFAPPRLVSVSRRENILLWLDALAKWSMLDIFVLVLTLAAFRVSVQSPDVGFLPDGFYSLDLLVVPKWGLYANMIAQLISQISSHFIIHYHRQVVRQAETSRLFAQSTVLMDVEDDFGGDAVTDDGLVRESTGSEQSEDRERLCDHAFSRPHRGECDRLVPRSFVNKGLVAVFICMAALIIAGCSVPSYSLDILGIVGILVESGQQFTEATSYYNIFETVGLLFDQASFTGKVGDYLGLGTLSTILVLTTLVVPLVQSVALMYMWFVPISRRRRYRLMIAIETLAAWQYAEVYFFSVIVGSWQLGPVSEYIINAYCGSLSGRFAQLVYYGILKEDDAQCFRVDVSLEPGLFLLAAGSILLALLNTFVLKSVRQYDYDKLQLERLEERNEKAMAAISSSYDSDEELDKIHPVPVMFTDTFRWLLQRENPALRVVPTSNSDSPSRPQEVRSMDSFEERVEDEVSVRDESVFYD